MGARFGEVQLARAIASTGGQIAATYNVATKVSNAVSFSSIVTYWAYSNTEVLDSKESQLNALKALSMANPGNSAVLTEITKKAKEVHDLIYESNGNTAGMLVGFMSAIRLSKQLGANSPRVHKKIRDELSAIKKKYQGGKP